MTVWHRATRWWSSQQPSVQGLLAGLAGALLLGAMVAFVGIFGLFGVDWLLRTISAWRGPSEALFGGALLAIFIAGCLYGAFVTLDEFAQERARERRRARPDLDADAIDVEMVATLTPDERQRLAVNINTIAAFPALFDDLMASVAYDELRRTLAPYPDLSKRFFERFDPVYEARISSYLYGPPPSRRFDRTRRVWALVTRRSPS